LSGEEVKVRIAAGTPNGKKLKIKGHGVKRNHEQGDLIVTIDVQVPQRVDSKAKKALEDFASATIDFDPRAELKQRSQA
jgi:molecular chaperone DnaJ